MSHRYYRVGPSFWSDPRIVMLSDDGRLLALYLLTCSHRTSEGLFRLPKAYAIADLQWSMKRLAEPFAQLIANGFIEYDADEQVCLIVAALKWQAPANENVAKAAVARLAELPPTPLLKRFLHLAEQHCPKWLPELLRERFGNGMANHVARSSSSSSSSFTSSSATGNGREGEVVEFDPRELPVPGSKVGAV